MDLYRVMKFSRFEQITTQKALAFASHRKWVDDPHEAPLIQALTTNDGLVDVLRVLKEHGEIPARMVMLTFLARCADASVYMQCWTKTPEHNLMWDRYGDGSNAVRARMTEAGQRNLPNWITLHNARYEDEFDIWKELEAITAKQQRASISTIITWSSAPSVLSSGQNSLFGSGFFDLRKSFTFKLKAYEHENEVRLMTPIFNDFAKPGKVSTPPWSNSPNGDPDMTLVPIGDIKNVISSLMVGPQADDDLQRSVEQFCRKHGLEYEGKSLLRTRRYTGSKKIFTTDPEDPT